MKKKILYGAKVVGRMCRLLGLFSLLTAAGLGPIAASGGNASGEGPLPAGWGGDAYGDLAVGVPAEQVVGKDRGGVVNVLYGTGSGLSARDQMWYQGLSSIEGVVETGDRFGSALAAGDLNGDGYADLAVGVPFDKVEGTSSAGAVNVLYGTDSGGLSEAENELWHQNITGVAGVAETGDQFGSALIIGDFNGDSYDDLAVGVPYEDIDGAGDAGAVNVLYGVNYGLAVGGTQLWHQNSPGMSGVAESNDRFGYALAAGDLDRDGYDDLAVGIPGEMVDDMDYAGAVTVLYGSAAGLLAERHQVWHQDSPAIAGVAEFGDSFGAALAAGDLNGDGYEDLAVGVPSEEVDGSASAGAVNVLYGSSGGLWAVGNEVWSQNSASVAGASEVGDDFGAALAIGDLDGDGYDDLAVGVPDEALDGTVSAGAVNVLYGTLGGLSAARGQMWHQNSPDVIDAAEIGDGFGFALAAGDLDGDGNDDLIVGVPYEEVEGAASAGAVNVLYGSESGLSAAWNQMWHQNSPAVTGTAEAGDRFGYALAVLPHGPIEYRAYLPLVMSAQTGP
jgi:disulfide bond formation protein DsbB